jgi:hypothetical protein
VIKNWGKFGASCGGINVGNIKTWCQPGMLNNNLLIIYNSIFFMIVVFLIKAPLKPYFHKPLKKIILAAP